MELYIRRLQEEVISAKERISDTINVTPIFTSTTLDEKCQRKFYLKAENLQKTGSFKARGALNANEKRFKHNKEEEVISAKERISDTINVTPIFTSTTLDEKCQRKFYLKAENLQKTGSFKARGALNAVMSLKDAKPDMKGVMTFSSGNHGQGLAWAAHLCNLTCTVVVPRGTPKVKTDAIQGYGGKVVWCEDKYKTRDEICAEFNKPDDVAYIPGSDDIHVIAGQGTIALEFLQQVPYLDAIFVATGSGGVIAGVAVAAKSINPQIKIYMVEPEGKFCGECLESGKRLWSSPPQLIETIADGIRAQPIVKSAWPIVLRMVEKDVFTVSDEEIIQGMRFSLERMKLLIEPATGATIAAVMSEKIKTLHPNIRNIGVILCGGNTDVENLPWLSRNPRTRKCSVRTEEDGAGIEK